MKPWDYLILLIIGMIIASLAVGYMMGRDTCPDITPPVIESNCSDIAFAGNRIYRYDCNEP